VRRFIALLEEDKRSFGLGGRGVLRRGETAAEPLILRACRLVPDIMVGGDFNGIRFLRKVSSSLGWNMCS